MRRSIALAWVAFVAVLLVVNLYVAAWLQFELPQEGIGEALFVLLAAPLAGVALACTRGLTQARPRWRYAWIAVAVVLVSLSFWVQALGLFVITASIVLIPVYGLPACAGYIAVFHLRMLEEPRRSRLLWMTGIAAMAIYVNVNVLCFAPEFRQRLYPWSVVRSAMVEERARLQETTRAMGIQPGAAITPGQRAELERRLVARMVTVPLIGRTVKVTHDWSFEHLAFFWMDGRFTQVDLNTLQIKHASD